MTSPSYLSKEIIYVSGSRWGKPRLKGALFIYIVLSLSRQKYFFSWELLIQYDDRGTYGGI